MKINKWLFGVIALFGLLTFSGVNKEPVHAMPSANTARGQQYWFKTRHVRAKYGFRAYLIHDTDPEVDSYKVTSKYIRKGTPLYVNYRGIEWEWTLSKHYFNGRTIGYYPGHNYWVAVNGSSKWAPYTKKRNHRTRRPKYIKARFKQTNSKRIAKKSGYGEFEKLINKRNNVWYEHIINNYDPNNPKARIRAAWDFYPKDHIYWTNTHTNATYKHLHKNIWVRVKSFY